jgi:endonuclease YncB( thermonuclease family)
MRTLLLAALASSWPLAAAADPCTAPLPKAAGATFSGTVRYVGDGDSLCVGPSRDPATWIEVRLGDFDAPELHSAEGPRAKALLEDVALGRKANCTAVRGRTGRVVVHDRVIALCTVDGVAIGDRMRALGAPEGGR